jgi:transposase
VPYEAPQGRRLNVIGGYFSHGPARGEFQFATFASVPRSEVRRDGSPRKPLAELAAEHGLAEEDIGIIDSEVFLGFVWQLAGRPVDAAVGWRRERPLMVVIDNYSVHKSARVRLEVPALETADVYLVYLPAYSPNLSRIEPQWQIAKYYELPQRSYPRLGDLKSAVEAALLRRATELRLARSENGQLFMGSP